MISVKAPDARPKGSLFLTTVYSDMDTTIAKWVGAQWQGDTLVVPRQEFIPPSISADEYMKMVGEMMEESKTVAKIVALRQAGYEVKATGAGARVENLLPNSTAIGILQTGDVVVTAQDQHVETATDLVNLVRRQKPGSSISLTIQRGNETFATQVSTKESDSEPGIAVIGILIKTHLFGHDLPVQIDIDSENIGGPSAGLMFTLGIIDSLEENGLAPGHKIAGTGTISLDGSVGPIGGVAQKVIGAEEAGAEYFLAPADNYEAAKQAARRIQVVRVENVANALQFLRGLQPAPASNLTHLRLPLVRSVVPAA